MIENVLGVIVAILAILLSIFHAQPPPPQSPLLYQWENTYSHLTKYREFDIFYKDVPGVVNNSQNLVVLHGFPTSSFDFHLLSNSFRKLFNRVVYIDFLGAGFSDKPRRHVYSFLEQATIVEFVLSDLKIRNFHIISHDYGGSVALELLSRPRLNPAYKLKIQSVAIINGAIASDLYKVTWPMYLLRLPFLGPTLSRFTNQVLFARDLDEIFGRNKLDHFIMRQLWFLVRYNDGYRAWPSILLYLSERPMLEKKWIETFQLSKVPICLFHGPADPVVSYEKTDELLRVIEPRPCIERLRPHVGHYPHLEDPASLVDTYVRFLRVRVGLKINQTQTVIVLPKTFLVSATA